MNKTAIEWTDFTSNPIRARRGDRTGHYCEKISPGCAHCYASKPHCAEKAFRTLLGMTCEPKYSP
jgi:protein gp37